MPKTSPVHSRIRQAASVGLPPCVFVCALLTELRGLLAHDAGAFFWLDEYGVVTNFYADKFPEPRSYSPRADRLVPQMIAGSECEVSHHAYIATTTITSEPIENLFYRDLLEKSEAHHIIHADLRRNGHLRARLSIYRGESGEPFSKKDIEELAAIIPNVVDGVFPKTATTRDVAYGDSFSEDLFITDHSGDILYATDRGRQLLWLSVGYEIRPAGLASVDAEAAHLLRLLLAEARSRASTTGTFTVRDTIWGRFLFRFFKLATQGEPDNTLWGVTIAHQRPTVLQVLQSVNSMPLSHQQRQIALMLAQGKKNKQIAAALGVSINTVGYHVKQLFTKFAVHDRSSLVAKVTGGSRSTALTPWSTSGNVAPIHLPGVAGKIAPNERLAFRGGL